MPLGQCSVLEVRDKLYGLPQPVESEQVRRARDALARGQGGVVGAAHCDGGMRAIREPDDQIRIDAAPDAHDLDPLAAEGMVGMGNGHESQRRLGLKGSVL
jgi:hypothetical protein